MTNRPEVTKEDINKALDTLLTTDGKGKQEKLKALELLLTDASFDIYDIAGELDKRKS